MITRRKFLCSLAGTTLAGAALGGGGYWAASRVTLHRQDVFLAGLPAAFEGYTIAFLSDTHHSPWVSRAHLRQAVDLANRWNADLVALGGDYIHVGSGWVEGCFTELSRLRAKHGVVGVLGNHDHRKGAAPFVRRAFERAGFVQLDNTGIDLWRDGRSLRVGGVGDLWRDKQDLPASLSGVVHPGAAIVLSHNPDFAETLEDDRVGLVLSGHTHGGQCDLPGLGAPYIASAFGNKYAKGLCSAPYVPVFVTTGVGSSFPPIRVNCPPEVALLTLRATRRVSAAEGGMRS